MAALKPKYSNAAIKSIYGFFSGDTDKILKFTYFIQRAFDKSCEILIDRFGITQNDVLALFKEPIAESEEENSGFVAAFDTENSQLYVTVESAISYYVKRRFEEYVAIIIHEIEHALQAEAVGKIQKIH